MQHSQNVYSVVVRQVKNEMIFDDETSQTDLKRVLFAPGKRTVAQKNKFVLNFFDKLSGSLFVVFGGVIPNVFEVFDGSGGKSDVSPVIFL